MVCVEAPINFVTPMNLVTSLFLHIGDLSTKGRQHTQATVAQQTVVSLTTDQCCVVD